MTKSRPLSIGAICLYEIVVEPARRRSGVGTELIGALQQVAARAGSIKTWTVTNLSNHAAVRLFGRTGAERDPAGDGALFVYRR